MKVLKALQDAVTNHNLAVQSNPPPPEPIPTNITPVKNHVRQMPVHSFQVNPNLEGSLFYNLHVVTKNSYFSLYFKVKMVRYGRQTVSVDVDTGALLFDRKAGLLGIETVSHDRSKKIFTF